MSYDPHSHLQGISAFVHAVETGSFTAAARRMGLSKSAVGKTVARLEERLGSQLLHRTTRRLDLTTNGRAYYMSCLRILSELAEAEAFVAARHEEVSGRLRINLPVSFGRMWVMPVLQSVAQKHPRLSVEAIFSDSAMELLDDDIDLVVRMGHPSNHTRLIGRRIGTQRWILCAAPSYLEIKGTPTTLNDLQQQHCLAFAHNGRRAPWLLHNKSGDLMEVKVDPRHTICHKEALLDAAVGGMGLAYLSTCLAGAALRDGRLTPVMMPAPVNGNAIRALWHTSRETSVNVRVVVDALASAFLPTPPWEVDWSAISDRPEAVVA